MFTPAAPAPQTERASWASEKGWERVMLLLLLLLRLPLMLLLFMLCCVAPRPATKIAKTNGGQLFWPRVLLLMTLVIKKWHAARYQNVSEATAAGCYFRLAAELQQQVC